MARIKIAQILRFALVGCFGFIADTGVLFVLAKGLQVSPLPSRIFSFLCAASLTFWFNRRFTFKVSGAVRSQWIRYVLITGIGAVINIGAFYAWISGMGIQAMNLILGSALGSLLALFFNFFASRALVFAPDDVE